MSLPYASCGDINVNKTTRSPASWNPQGSSGETGITFANPESITDFINAMKARKERKWGQEHMMRGPCKVWVGCKGGLPEDIPPLCSQHFCTEDLLGVLLN